MSRRLAPLRRTLDVMPSPVEDRPGLLLRDPFGYTDEVVIIPPPLVPFLRVLRRRARGDGPRRRALPRDRRRGGERLRARGSRTRWAAAASSRTTSSSAASDERHRAFAEADRACSRLTPATRIPKTPAQLGALLDGWLRPRRGDEAAGRRPASSRSPRPTSASTAASASYAAAYRALPADAAERTFVVLGTSHYGAPERFGLTRKAYVTPFGAAAHRPGGRRPR